MKPIKLTIKGINSYVSEQVIHFDKLAESNVFGIFGETGSGKTTILDSIILSLYGVTDRDNLQNVINVNIKDAYVIFEFEMDNISHTTNYIVRRDFRLRPSGLKAEAILTDITNNVTVAEMPDNVNAALLKIIGVSKKEFLKCIALPQGEFDRFLSDTPAIRKRTLAKIFNLEKFGATLNEKVKRRKELLELRLTALREKRAIFGDISQEKVDAMVEELVTFSKDKETLESSLAIDKERLEVIKDIMAKKQKFLDIQASLSVKKSEAIDIDYMKKQIEYSKKYGDYIGISNKYKNYYNEIKNLTEDLNNKKENLSRRENELLSKTQSKESTEITLKNATNSLNTYKLNAERLSLHTARLKELNDEKHTYVERVNKCTKSIDETTKKLREYDTIIIDLERSLDSLEEVMHNNEVVITRISESTDIKAMQDFVSFLRTTKNKISPEAMMEVEGYAIHDEVGEVIKDIESYENYVNKEIIALNKSYESMLQGATTGDIFQLKDNLLATNKALEDKCDLLTEKITNAKERSLQIKAEIENFKTVIVDSTKTITRLDEEIALTNHNINGVIGSKDDIKFLEKSIDSMNKTLATLDISIEGLTKIKQELVVAIEVGTSNIENYKEQLKEITATLEGFNSPELTFGDEADLKLLIDESQIEENEKHIEEFYKEYNHLESSYQELETSLKGIKTNQDDLDSLSLKIDNDSNKLAEINVYLNVNRDRIETMKANLEKINQIDKDFAMYSDQLDTAVALQELLANGSLLEYVSEEYLLLITNFSNKYVYQISKGKYLLNYDGEFNVLDNFNGGIKRSVKTLSGGERFIVSLSLALGISQSISVNNNKNFNFFFIDEGFGNLSEGYIEKVLQSFDQLIKLNFTVGFITHVENMQYYINNKVLVTKDSNEEGSKIKEYY